VDESATCEEVVHATDRRLYDVCGPPWAGRVVEIGRRGALRHGGGLGDRRVWYGRRVGAGAGADREGYAGVGR
jgi:hypothetical protein